MKERITNQRQVRRKDKAADSEPDQDCPCGAKRFHPGGKKTPLTYSECCGVHHAQRAAPTAEALMRSRYCAFVRADEAYLLATWHPQTRPASVELDGRQRWLGLKIGRVVGGQEEDQEGTVEFVARYKIDGKGHRLIEKSRFLRVEGAWLYHSG